MSQSGYAHIGIILGLSHLGANFWHPHLGANLGCSICELILGAPSGSQTGAAHLDPIWGTLFDSQKRAPQIFSISQC